MKEQMREAFEAWAEKELLPLDKRDSEHYRYNLTNRAWAGWKAALSAVPANHVGDSNEMVQSQAQQTESQWQPMETAPKNKKIIVRYKNVCDKERTVFAKYIEEFTEESNSETECETDYHEERDTYYLKEGWVEMIDNWDEFSCVYFDSRNVPTHWMDIPPAPEGDKS